MINKIKKFFIIIVVLNTLIFLRVLSLIFKLRKEKYVFLREDRLGHQSGNSDVEISKALRLKKNKINTIFIFYEKDKNLANKYLRHILIERIKTDFKYIVLSHGSFNSKILYFLINKIQSFSLFDNTIYLANTDVGRRENVPTLVTSNDQKKLCRELKLNPKGYVCIYSRDDKFLDNKIPNIDWSYHKYRNSDIDKLKELSLYLTSYSGLSVVRIGSNPAKRLYWNKNEDPIIFDYSFSKFRSEKNDIDLICGCSLYVSNGGGPEGVAMAARRNMFKINQIPLGDEHDYDFGPWAPKIHFLGNTEDYLSLIDICRFKLENKWKTSDFVSQGINLKENQSSEILSIYKDYVKYKNGKFNTEEKNIISRYKKLREKINNKWDILSNKNNFISPSFLFKYQNLLKY